MAEGEQHMMEAKEARQSLGIDLVPKCVQQPRGPAPKRRTDFSLFITPYSSSPSSINSDSSPDFPDTKDTLSTAMESNHASSSINGRGMDQCANKGDELFSDYAELNVIQADLLPLSKLIARIKQKGKARKTPEFETEKSKADRRPYLCKTPVIRENHTCADTEDVNDAKHLLVQCHLNHKSTHCQTMRDHIPGFNDAQTSHRNGHLSTFRQLAYHRNKHNSLDNHKQSSGSGTDKLRPTSSSHTEGGEEETGRGKRKRKPKLHFDELSSSMELGKKVRRFKIMRSLGLKPPVGSPFALTN